MEIKRIVVSLFQTNCYIIKNNDDVLIVDPGAGYKKIIEQLGQDKPLAILLTHGHLDHIGAVDKLYEKYHCPIYASQQDEKMLRDEKYNTLSGYCAKVNSPIEWIDDLDSLHLASFDIKILFTPGHTKGSLMYLIEDCLFSGDTLFHMSVGRTDLYGGSQHQLLESLEILRTLDPDITVYPGHDEITSIGYELKNNPYL